MERPAPGPVAATRGAPAPRAARLVARPARPAGGGAGGGLAERRRRATASAHRGLRVPHSEPGVSGARVRQQDAQPRPSAVAPRQRDAAARGAVLVLALGRPARRRARIQGRLQLYRRPHRARRGRRHLPAYERALQCGAARRFGDPRAPCAQHRRVRREPVCAAGSRRDCRPWLQGPAIPQRDRCANDAADRHSAGRGRGSVLCAGRPVGGCADRSRRSVARWPAHAHAPPPQRTLGGRVSGSLRAAGPSPSRARKGIRMNAHGGRIRSLLIVVIAGSVGGAACGREKPSPTAGRQLRFEAAAAVPREFLELAADRTRLWLTTYSGVIAVDPVAERWTAVYVDSQPVGQSQLVPCDARIWLVGRDTLLLADPEGQRFEMHTLPADESTAPRARHPPIMARCAANGLWAYDGARLFHVPVAGAGTAPYQVPALGDRATVRDFVDGGAGGVYFLAYVPGPSGPFALARFDTATKTIMRIDVPTGPEVYGFSALDRADDRVLLRTYDRRVFASQGSGPQWTELPPPGGVEREGRGGPTVLAQDKGVVWVGASYDVSPASYFVLRYIRDAAEPQDLVVLRDYYTRIRSGARTAVQHLGMLWIASDSTLLRIDPASGELVRYRPRPGGAIDKQAFHLTQDKGVLKYFDGDSLRTLTENGIPSEPAASDTTEQPSGPDSLPAKLGKKRER